MSTFLKAGTAFLLVGLITGTLPPLSPHWRAVAVDLRQAQPQAKMKVSVLALFQAGKGLMP